MKHAKKLTLSLIALLLAGVLCFAFVGCASYNEGYEQLFAYIEENNKNEPGDTLQAEVTFDNISSYDARILFTVTEKGNRIRATSISDDVIEGQSSFLLEPEGFSESDPIEIEVMSDKIGGYYYKATSYLFTTTQTTFSLVNLQYSTSMVSNFKAVPSSLQSSVRQVLDMVVTYTGAMLKTALEDELGIPLELFYNEA